MFPLLIDGNSEKTFADLDQLISVVQADPIDFHHFKAIQNHTNDSHVNRMKHRLNSHINMLQLNK